MKMQRLPSPCMATVPPLACAYASACCNCIEMIQHPVALSDSGPKRTSCKFVHNQDQFRRQVHASHARSRDLDLHAGLRTCVCGQASALGQLAPASTNMERTHEIHTAYLLLLSGFERSCSALIQCRLLCLSTHLCCATPAYNKPGPLHDPFEVLLPSSVPLCCDFMELVRCTLTMMNI